jgi:hypothetical protein
MTGCRPGALRDDQGKKSGDERETRHHHRAKSQTCRFDCGGVSLPSALWTLPVRANIDRSCSTRVRNCQSKPIG